MADNRLEFQQISQLIENQFPAIYREDGPIFVAFVEAYYEWLETFQGSAYNEGRNLIKISDIDTTLDKYLEHFKFTYLDNFPYTTYVDQRFLIKHVMDFYRTKGTPQSTKLFMKLLFGQEVEVYYPGGDVLKPSDSLWKRPEYLEVSSSPRTKEFIDRKIFGAASGAAAFVDSVVRKRIDGKLIDIIYISSVEGTFVTGESVSDDGEIINAPIVVGSLSYFDVSVGGRNNKIGDVFDVVAPGGAHGKIRVTGTEDATGRVNFSIVDGGQGYTLDTNTKVYVSDTILSVDNPQESFIDLETVYQKLNYIELFSSNTIMSTAQAGDILIGKDSSNTTISQGRIVAVTPSGPLPTANGSVIVNTTFGTFLDQVKLTVNTAPTGVLVGETIIEEKEGQMTILSSGGTINIGDKVEQYTYSNIEPTLVIEHSTATVTGVSGSELTIDNYFGNFLTGTIRVNNSFNANLGSIIEVEEPATAKITNITGNDLSLSDNLGSFEVGKRIRTNRTRKKFSVSALASQGASDVLLQKNGATGVIDTTEDRTISAIVIGQSTSDIGVFGNRNFYVSNTFPVYIKTDRTMMISPPRDSNNNIIELEVAVAEKSSGNSAKFEIGALVNEQTVTVHTDLLSGNNVANVRYMDIRLDGMNSGLNTVQSYVINNPGTQYTNGDIVNVSGGGYANSEPFMSAHGVITTDGSGAITFVDPVEWGSGYFVTPVAVLPATSGTTAQITPVLDMAYGFPKNPPGNYDDPIADLLDVSTMIIGSIATMKRINPGTNYNKSPYVRVINRKIAAFQRGNFNLVLRDVVGNFQAGEEIYQQVGPEQFAKGTVISYAGTDLVLYVERDLFETGFNEGLPIIGSMTGSQGYIVAFDRLYENIFGDNAAIDSTVIAANGVITSVEVIDSGFGYMAGEGELVSDTNLFTVSGNLRLGKHGIAEGFWETTNSHLNSEKKIHDNNYYQEFSYDIISSMSLTRYADILKQVTHVAGTKMFGSVETTAVKEMDLEPLSEIIIS